jgi:bifunctional DNase/RNase
LGESAGSRRLPIIIGGFEAQAIAIELEKMKPTRPLTHDLFKSFAETFNVNVIEILIYNLVEGIFYAKLICTDGTKDIEIDARTSDAIAIAVRFNCPIFTYEFILESSGIVLDDATIPSLSQFSDSTQDDTVDSENEFKTKSSEELKKMLETALDNEQYEMASKIRDEINTRKES